jgi:hypothetical protein
VCRQASDRALVAAMLAGHEQAPDAVPAHAAERHRADCSSPFAMSAWLRTDRERNQGGHCGDSARGRNFLADVTAYPKN